MKVSKDGWTAIAVGSGIVLVGLAIYGLTRPIEPLPEVQRWNADPIRAMQGLPITIALPRGESYLIASPDILLSSQVQRGNESHLVVIPLIVDEPTYTLTTVAVEQGSGRSYPLEFRVQPPREYLEEGRAIA